MSVWREHAFPATDVVILAGGKARRMNGVNKLLQQFDDDIQLLKIAQRLGHQAQRLWVNSHRDQSLYQQLLPNIRCFRDDEAGFLGPVMGMKSAWSHVQRDYVLFVPCDITYIPNHLLARLHVALERNVNAQAAYAVLNQQALYPLCLLKRDSLAVLTEQLRLGHLSVKQSLQALNAQAVYFQKRSVFVHSINSFEELQQYQQLLCLA